MRKFISIVLSFLCFSCFNEKKHFYIESINDFFEGKVIFIEDVNHQHGIICIELFNQSTFEYDEKIDGFYLFKIKGKRAELLYSYAHIKVGDRVVFNKKGRKILRVYRDDHIVYNEKVSFSAYGWNYMKNRASNFKCPPLPR